MFEFKHPSSCLVAGPSGCGKTYLVRQMIKKNIYEPKIRKVRWCYNYPAPWFLEEPDIEFIHGLPENFESGDLIVIDDLMHRLNEKIADIFTAASHHRNVSVILILQNLFPRVKVMRDISLNTHYIIVFKITRDMSQVNCLGRQLYPTQSKFFLDAYIKATHGPYHYLVIDLQTQTSHLFRLRDSLFPTRRGIYWIYAPL